MTNLKRIFDLLFVEEKNNPEIYEQWSKVLQKLSHLDHSQADASAYMYEAASKYFSVGNNFYILKEKNKHITNTRFFTGLTFLLERNSN